MASTSIENKEIRGITWKVAVIVLGATITICSTFLFGYFGLIKQIDQSNNRGAVNEIAIKELRIRLDKMEVDVQQLKEQYYQLSFKNK